LDDLREFFFVFFSAGWNMASNRKYSPLTPLASLSVGSTRLHSTPIGLTLGSSRLRSTWPDQARIPTGNDVRLFEFRIQERQKTRASRPLAVFNRAYLQRWRVCQWRSSHARERVGMGVGVGVRGVAEVHGGRGRVGARWRVRGRMTSHVISAPMLSGGGGRGGAHRPGGAVPRVVGRLRCKRIGSCSHAFIEWYTQPTLHAAHPAKTLTKLRHWENWVSKVFQK